MVQFEFIKVIENKKILIQKACKYYNLLIADLHTFYKTSCNYTKCDDCKNLRFMTWDDYYKQMTSCNKNGIFTKNI